MIFPLPQLFEQSQVPKCKDVREQESPEIRSSVPIEQKPLKCQRESKTGLYPLLEEEDFWLGFPSVFHVMFPKTAQPSPAQMSAEFLAEPITVALGPL